MRSPSGFHSLTAGLHQDAIVFAEGSAAKLASNCLEFVRDQQKDELRLFLSKVLEEKTPAELKGILNREKRDIGFGSKGAKAFLCAVLDELNKATP